MIRLIEAWSTSPVSGTARERRQAELLPEDKVAAVGRPDRQAGQVAMIADGVNNATALARATHGVANTLRLLRRLP